MSAHQTDTDHPTATRVWWQLLQLRIGHVSASLPGDLKGVIQFEVDQPNAGTDCFYLSLAGPATSGHDGKAESYSTRVKTTEDELADLMFSPEMPEGALRVGGDFTLFDRFMGCLEDAPEARSWLAMRASK